MTDAQHNIGKLIKGDAERDAIHIALAPVVAGMDLKAGDHIGFDADDTARSDASNKIGIVDPFLRLPIRKGDRFYMFLYPNTITALRHEWTHPAFARDDGEKRKISQEWMDNFAGQYGFSSIDMIDAGRDWIRSGEYLCDGGTFEGESVPAEFWDHYQRLTGEMVESDKRESFFTCAC